MNANLKIFLVLITLSGSLSAQDFPNDGLIASDKVRARSAPSLTAPVLANFDKGTVVTVLARSKTSLALEKDGTAYWWYQIILPDQQKAWVHGSLLYIRGLDDENLPQNTLQLPPGTNPWFARTFSAPVDEKNEEPPLFHYLLTLANQDQRALFFTAAKKDARALNLDIDHNGWLHLSANDQGWQEWKAMSLSPDGKVLELTLVDHQGHNPETILVLRFTYNKSKGTMELRPNP